MEYVNFVCELIEAMRRRFENMLDLPFNRIVFDNTNLDPANISGEVNGEIIQEIRSKIRRCLAKKTGNGVAICYLDRNNSNFYHDGVTASGLTGLEGDVMVRFPDIYTKYELIDDDHFAYKFALSDLDGTYRKQSGFLVGAAEAVIASNKSYSRFGVESTSSVSQANHKAYARARGILYQDQRRNRIIRRSRH